LRNSHARVPQARAPPSRLLSPVHAVYTTPIARRCTTFEGLSSRQCQCVALVHRGFTDQEIATTLGISIHTVGTHIRSAQERVGIHRHIHSRLLLALWAERTMTNSLLLGREIPGERLNTAASAIAA